MRTLLSMQRPFLMFIETRYALILEEIKGKNNSLQATTLVANVNHGTPRTSSSTNSGGPCPNFGGDDNYSNSGSGGNCYSNYGRRSRRNCDNSGGNGNNIGGRGPFNNTGPWPSVFNPWTDIVQMWSFQSQPPPALPRLLGSHLSSPAPHALTAAG